MKKPRRLPVPPEEVQSRFWAKVDTPEDGCWLWRAAARASDGIGVFGFKGRVFYAHRVAYVIVHGLIPRGMEVRRSCSNPLCVRPLHLALVSKSNRTSIKMLPTLDCLAEAEWLM